MVRGLLAGTRSQHDFRYYQLKRKRTGNCEFTAAQGTPWAAFSIYFITLNCFADSRIASMVSGMKSVLPLLSLLLSSFASAQLKPNLVFIIADDLTFRDIGCYGGQAHTPNIDFLATEGMLFERCFQASSMCSPTRHNIYTGLYPFNSGAYPNHTFAKLGTKSDVHYLQPLGYRVALSGKTHIKPQSVFPFEYSAKDNNPDMEAIDRLMGESVANGNPFCLFACSNEPHGPWDKGDASIYPPEKVILPPYIVDTPEVREGFSAYLAEITYYDGQVGQILALLEKHGLSGNTLVMVVSEQGNSMPFAKWTGYGNGLQSAMIVRWPGHVEPGSLTSALVEYTDVLPTFIDAAGGVPESSLDGESLLPVLLGQSDRHRDYVFGQVTTRGINNGSDAYPIRTVRDENFRLIWNLMPETKYANAYTGSKTFKSMIAKADSGDGHARELVSRYQHRPEFELFDCLADPLEMNSLAGNPEYASVIERLKGKLDAWMAGQGDAGIQTELDAKYHMRNAQSMSRAEVDAEWAKRKR